MALKGTIYGSFTGTSTSNVRPALEWSATQSVANNTSTITATLVFLRYNSQWQSFNRNGRSMTITIDGNSASSVRAFDIRGKSREVVWTRTVTVKHNSDGRKSVKLGASGSTGVSLGSFNFSSTVTLDTIPRESKITSFSLSDRTCTEFRVNWRTDKTVDRVRYRLNGGSWVNAGQSGTSGNFKVTGRSPNTTYRVQIEVRNRDSGLTTTSSTKSISTYRLSTYSVPNRNTGQSITVSINRATSNLTHDVTLQYNDGSWRNWITLNNQTGSATFNPTSSQLNTLYNARPNHKTIPIRVSVVNKWNNGQVQGTNTSGSATLTIVNANPSIDGVTYRDVNSTIQAILNNDQKILRNKSDLRVTSGRVTSQKGATLRYLTVSIGGKDTRVNISGTSVNNVNINVGKVNQSSNQTATITVTDSRGYTATRSFTVQVLDYQEPQITYADAERLNNYEEPTTLNIQGRRAVIKPASVDINEVELRYRVKQNPDGSYGSWVDANTTNGSVSGLWQTFNVNQYMADYPNDKTYTIEIQVRDKFTSWKSTAIPIMQAQPLMKFMQDLIEINADFKVVPKGNKRGFQIVGKDHMYIEFYPRGVEEGRKAYLGFPNAGSQHLRLRNEDEGNLELSTKSGYDVTVNGKKIVFFADYEEW